MPEAAAAPVKPPLAAPVFTVEPSAESNVGTVNVTIYDGARQPLKQGTDILLTVIDGFQNQVLREDVLGPRVTLKLPIHNNSADNYSVIAFTKGHDQAGYFPVTAAAGAPQALDLMLLDHNAGFNFANATWNKIAAADALLAGVFAASTTASPAGAWSQIMESAPDHLACLLDLSTAMRQIFLRVKTPFDYFKSLDLSKLAPDRIFGYADAALVSLVREAAAEGEFDTQSPADLALHPGSTSSFKENRFGEANVQLTFHENDKKTIDGVDCILVEPDIDYYRDLGAHFILEVLPNAVTGGKTNPRLVYVLRWMASRHAGIPDFDPPYSIV